MTEALNGFFVLIMILGILVGIVTALVLLIMALRKNKIKIPLWITGSSFFVAFLGLIGVVVIATVNTFSEPATTTPTASNNSPSSTTDTSSHETEENEPENEEEVEDQHLTEDGRDPNDFSEYRSDFDLRDIERNPEEYQDDWFAFEGRIIQVMEDNETTVYRIAVNDDIDRVIYLETLTITLEERFLEDDHVQVYGAFYDLVTYETVMGANRTIPAFNAFGERIILQGEVTE